MNNQNNIRATTTQTQKSTLMIDIKRVINKDLLNSLGKILKCPLCVNILYNPYDCDKCGNSFCLDCISNYKCPFNCENSKIKQCSQGIKYLLSSLLLKCEYPECNDEIPYNNIAVHDSNCEYKIINCLKCNELMRRKDLDNHKKEDCENEEKLRNTILNQSQSQNQGVVNNMINNTNVNVNINIPQLMRQTEMDFSKFSRETNKMKNEISQNMDNLFKGLYESKKKVKKEKVKEDLKEIVENNVNIISEVKSVEKSNKNILQISTEDNFNIEYNISKEEKNNLKNNLQNYLPNFDFSKYEQYLLDLSKLIEIKFGDMDDKFKKIESNICNNVNNNLNNNVNTNLTNQTQNNQPNNDKQQTMLTNLIRNTKDSLEKSFHELAEYLKQAFKEIKDINQKELIKAEVSMKRQRTNNNLDKILSVNNNPNTGRGFTRGLEELTESLLSFQPRENKTQNLDNNINERGINTNTNNININNEKSIENNFFNLDEKNKIKSNELIKINKSEKNEISSSSSNNNEIIITELKNIKDSIANKLSELLKNIKSLSDEFAINSDLINKNIKNINLENKQLNITEKEKVNDNNNIDNKDKNIIIPTTVTETTLTTLPLAVHRNSTNINLLKLENYIKNDNNNTTEITHLNNTPLSNDKSKTIEDIFYKISFKIDEYTKNLDEKLLNLEHQNKLNIKTILKEMYNLKYCSTCETVDYFYGFLTCELCGIDYCKNCVLLCKQCKKLYCKKCLKCPRCDNLCCTNCRAACVSCKGISSPRSSITSSNKKYCSSCTSTCTRCKNLSCLDCIKNCFICSSKICPKCSKNCKACGIASCFTCGSHSDFIICFCCNLSNCRNCLENCEICDFEVCKNCIFKCKICIKIGCKKNLTECSSCNNSFCNKCSMESQHTKCFICNSNYCEDCIKQELVKCKQCEQKVCRRCYTVCRKCKETYCATCKIRCDNCKDVTCRTCIYKCTCDKYMFCEKCLFDVNPINIHDCLLFLNDKPVFTGSKTRSKVPLPRSFEAKFYIDVLKSKSVLIGVTDNPDYEEDSPVFIDKVWLFKPSTGQKYSTDAGTESYLTICAKEKDFLIISRINDELYFRINYEFNKAAFKLDKWDREYYFYIENDSPFEKTKISLIYIRKI